MANKVCIYIHGFNSAGCSKKGEVLRRAVVERSPAVHYLAPDLPYDPQQALQQLNALLAPYSEGEISIVGSSLGGFYAMSLSEQYKEAKIALVNPAVRPWQGVEHLLGDHKNPYTGEEVTVTVQDMDQLQQYTPKAIHNPGRFLLLLQTDDEVLNYQEAIDAFPGSPRIIKTGGGHRFSDFEREIAALWRFFELN